MSLHNLSRVNADRALFLFCLLSLAFAPLALAVLLRSTADLAGGAKAAEQYSTAQLRTIQTAVDSLNTRGGCCRYNCTNMC